MSWAFFSCTEKGMVLKSVQIWIKDISSFWCKKNLSQQNETILTHLLQKESDIVNGKYYSVCKEYHEFR